MIILDGEKWLIY